VAVLRRKLGEACRELPAGGSRGDPVLDLVGERYRHRVGAGTGERPVQADLLPAVPAYQVGGDPVQPWQRVAARQVIGFALPEGQQECLGDDIIGRVRAEPAHHVPLDPRRMAVKSNANCSGSCQESSITVASEGAAASTSAASAPDVVICGLRRGPGEAVPKAGDVETRTLVIARSGRCGSRIRQIARNIRGMIPAVQGITSRVQAGRLGKLAGPQTASGAVCG
jgi:hypothetical protein